MTIGGSIRWPFISFYMLSICRKYFCFYSWQSVRASLCFSYFLIHFCFFWNISKIFNIFQHFEIFCNYFSFENISKKWIYFPEIFPFFTFLSKYLETTFFFCHITEIKIFFHCVMNKLLEDEGFVTKQVDRVRGEASKRIF